MEINNKNKSGKIILLLGVAAGILLLFFGIYSEKEEETNESDLHEQVSGPEMTADEYALDLEKKIAHMCDNVKGVSGSRVVVTLSGGFNAVYAQNSQSSASGYRNEFVLTGSGNSERALLIGYSTPQISGIGVVCVGGGDTEIKKELISLISATYGISSNKIYVTEAQK